MTHEDIIRMAREAGIGPVYGYESIERFAALVAAAERNKLAAWMMRQGYATGHGDTTEDLLKKLDWQIDERIAAEREACASVCCDMIDAEYKTGKVDHNEMAWTQACAAAIRARK